MNLNRRKFFGLNLLGLGIGLAAPALASSEISLPTDTSDIYYTKDSVGRWNGKATTHLPNIDVSKTNGKISVTVITAHEMKGYGHYIFKHVLLYQNHKFIAEHMFNPLEDKVPQSSFTLDAHYSGILYALSMCNKHDVWLSSIMV